MTKVEREEVIAGMTKKEWEVIERAKALVQASDGRTLCLVPGSRIDVDVLLYASLSRAVTELRLERGESRFDTSRADAIWRGLSEGEREELERKDEERRCER